MSVVKENKVQEAVKPMDFSVKFTKTKSDNSYIVYRNRQENSVIFSR